VLRTYECRYIRSRVEGTERTPRGPLLVGMLSCGLGSPGQRDSSVRFDRNHRVYRLLALSVDSNVDRGQPIYLDWDRAATTDGDSKFVDTSNALPLDGRRDRRVQIQ